MFEWLKKTMFSKSYLKARRHEISVYPNSSSCVKQNMRHVKAEQMPPLMVRKAAWRK